MINFITDLTLTNLDNGYYKLTQDLVIQVDEDTFTVPKGFKTNLANTPKFLHGILPPDDSHYIIAAVLHDYLYSGGYHLSRRKSDRIFFKVMRAEDNSLCLSSLMFLAVRLFGSSHFYTR